MPTASTAQASFIMTQPEKVYNVVFRKEGLDNFIVITVPELDVGIFGSIGQAKTYDDAIALTFKMIELMQNEKGIKTQFAIDIEYK